MVLRTHISVQLNAKSTSDITVHQTVTVKLQSELLIEQYRVNTLSSFSEFSLFLLNKPWI